MASSGIDKWKKYFQGKEVETKVKAKPGQQVPVFNATGRETFTLEDGYPIKVLQTDTYSNKYPIVYEYKGKEYYSTIGEAYVAKPLKKGAKATDLQRLTASDFIGLGKDETITYGDKQVRVKKFTSHQQLAKSMLQGMKANRAISESVVEVFEEFFKKGYKKIEWNSEISDVELAKFGIYFGELLVGLYALTNNSTTISMAYKKNIIDGQKITGFIVPTDPSFSGVDSMLETEMGYIGISSKFGEGAKASLFSNLLAKGVKYRAKLKKSTFKDLADSAAAINITPDIIEAKRGSKNIVYEYGIRYILGIDKKKIPNTYDVFTNLKKGKLGPQEHMVVDYIRKSKETERIVIDNLPKSVTAHFNRTIAKRLNNDPVAIDQMKKILMGKDFWQANLDQKEWSKGHVKFNFVSSGGGELQIVGNKAAVPDIDAAQGMVNYVLKYK